MPNKVEQCIGCIYNTAKNKGGLGMMCNGITQEEHGRCPEWRITELIREGKEGNVIEKCQ